jgi:hypothetical protein
VLMMAFQRQQFSTAGSVPASAHGDDTKRGVRG